MDPVELARLRSEYESTGIDQAGLGGDPVAAFTTWFEQAVSAECTEPNAMVVSTVDNEGAPSARNVLLKEYDQSGFVFYTNYSSDKGRDIDQTGRAALTFSWLQLHRQVRINGDCARVSSDESDRYFALRPIGSQLGAWASDQSQPLDSRVELEQRFSALATTWGDGPVERPPHWGGYRVTPRRIEFWQGRTNRLHDRIVFIVDAESGSWRSQRLNP